MLNVIYILKKITEIFGRMKNSHDGKTLTYKQMDLIYLLR